MNIPRSTFYRHYPGGKLPKKAETAAPPPPEKKAGI